MGLRPSSYNSIWCGYLAGKFAQGDQRADPNAMRWDRIILNLPGSQDYDPALP
jgi:hypothetical protein